MTKRSDPFQPLRDRGISDDVIAGRGYLAYTKDDVTAVQEAYRGLPSAGSKATMTRWAGQSDGLLIVRHAPPGLGLADPFPEMRPSKAIETRTTVHVHPEVRPTEPLPNPATGQPLSPRHTHSARAMEKHIEKTKGLTHPHCGVNRDDVHEHSHEAKYLFPPRPWISKTATWVDADGATQTRTSRFKDRRVNYAKRIDVHPSALPLVRERSRVFFVIEGCLKADAILTQGEAVFSVPSVSLWDASELPAFAAEYLLGKFVVIVPDADWKSNGAVVTFARLARTFLMRLGVEAVVAAPPTCDQQGLHAECVPGEKCKRNGVDDFLAAGGAVDDLVVLGREKPGGLVGYPPPTKYTLEPIHMGHLPGWVKENLLMRQRLDGINRAVRTLDGLAEHVDADGNFNGTLAKLAKVIDLHPKQVERAIRDLQEIRHWGERDWNQEVERWERDGVPHPGPVDAAVKILDGGLETGPGGWKGPTYYEWREEWETRPTIRLHPDLRYPETKPMRLADHPQTPRPEIRPDVERQVEWFREHAKSPDAEFERRARRLLKGAQH
jgi:hypothetical protein